MDGHPPKTGKTRHETALALISEAERAGRTVILQSTTDRSGWSDLPVTATDAAALVQAAEAFPLRPSHKDTLDRIESISKTITPGQVIWLSDGLQRPASEELVTALSELADNVAIYEPETGNLAVIGDVRNEPTQLVGNHN